MFNASLKSVTTNDSISNNERDIPVRALPIHRLRRYFDEDRKETFPPFFPRKDSSKMRHSSLSHTVAFTASLVVSLVMNPMPTRAADDASNDVLNLTLRSRVESPALGGACRVIETPATWKSKETAIIVCDMWDLHHCLNATRRVVEIAPAMDHVLKTARDQGVLIIHAPSECTGSYEKTAARQRARSAPKSKTLPDEIGSWCKRIPSEEQNKYPVDQTDGGEDDDLAEHAKWAAHLKAIGRNPGAPWKSETDKLIIDQDRDVISDNGVEIWSVLEDRGINNVILMGVHTNMCVLGRPFGLRQMAKNGKNVVLMRDMTDTMYNPLRAPYVNHFTGNDRVAEHIERYVAPTVTSDQIVGGKPFRFKADTRPRVALIVAEDEYKTERTLPPFVAGQLGKDFKSSLVFDREDDKNTLTGTSAIDDADVLLVSARRRLFTEAQVAAIRKHVAAGKGVVGIRTANHAFSLKGSAAIPEGHAAWTEFDAEVLGGNYTGHHGEGSKVAVEGISEAASHPILNGVFVSKLAGNGSLYKVSPLTTSTTTLLMGTIPGQSAEPILWTNLSASGGRVVYTSLGHPDDFNEPDFVTLLRNAIYYASGKTAPTAFEPSSVEAIAFP